jgi:alginate O-acetyltransferase complex protein AlgI
VVAGWVLFRSASIDAAAGYYLALLRPGGTVPVDFALAAQPLAVAALVFGCASALIPAKWVTGVRLMDPTTRPIRVLRAGFALVVLPAAMVFVLTGTFSPFLYFQF